MLVYELIHTVDPTWSPYRRDFGNFLRKDRLSARSDYFFEGTWRSCGSQDTTQPPIKSTEYVARYCRKMATLYFSPGSCGAATYISAKAGNVSFKDTVVVDIMKHQILKNGEDFYKINPKGNVPAVVLEDGSLLNENCGTLFWVGKQGNGVLGKTALEEVQVVNMLGYLASEVHKSFGPLFFYQGDPAGRKPSEEALLKKFSFLEEQYLNKGSGYLVGDSFTVADSYLYVMLGWTDFVKLDMSSCPKVLAFKEKIGSLEFVKSAEEEMKALKAAQEAQNQ